MEIIGYIAAILMGLTLGMIGGGGSILTVPILVYLMGISPVIATGYSLLIVGLTAAFGAFQYYKKGLINIKASITFAIPSIIAVYLTRAYLMPAISDTIITEPFIVKKDVAIMVLFAILMVAAAFMMLRNSNKITTNEKKENHNIFLILIEGAVVGVVTGMLGAGGGFLIIPALVLLIGMDMKQAVGASLLIIALKSLIGFIGDIQAGIEFAIPLLPIFIICTLIGMWSATIFSHKIEGKKLQKFFAYFTFVIAAIIFYKELF